MGWTQRDTGHLRLHRVAPSFLGFVFVPFFSALREAHSFFYFRATQLTWSARLGSGRWLHPSFSTSSRTFGIFKNLTRRSACTSKFLTSINFLQWLLSMTNQMNNHDCWLDQDSCNFLSKDEDSFLKPSSLKSGNCATKHCCLLNLCPACQQQI